MKLSLIIIGLLLAFPLYGRQYSSDGEFKEFYSTGQLKIKGYYKQGRADSTWTFYFADGKTYKTGTYKNCVYDLGYIKILHRAIDNEWHERGIENGAWKIYYPNGILKTEYQSICGTYTGLKKTFDEKGNLETESFYSNGRLEFEKEFFETGVVSQYSTFDYYDIKEHKGYYTTYSRSTISVFYETGELEELYHEDKYELQGNYKKFWKSGFLQYEAMYNNGEEEGIVKEFFDNGLRESETEYKKGKKQGQSVFYSRDGRIIKEQTWVKGVLIKEK